MALLLAVCFAPDVQAQEEPRTVETAIGGVELSLGGTFQPRLSYGFTEGGEGGDLQRAGVGLRRARFRVDAAFGDGFGVHYDVDLGGGSLRSVDLYGFYEPTERLRFRAGYLAGAQPRAYIFTSHTRTDAVERAAIAERWSRGTIGSSGRDFGVDVRYQTEQAVVEVFVHNGDGSFDRDRGNFRQSVSGLSATRGADTENLAVGAYASVEPAAVPGLEVGGFAGYNGSRNPNTALTSDDLEVGRSYVSYSGHVYWGAAPGSQAVRLKADVIGILYEEVDFPSSPGPFPGTGTGITGGFRADAQHSLGWAAFAAARVFGHGEIFARYEQFYADLDGDPDDYMTAGMSYSLSAQRGLPYRQERLTLAYANGLPANAALGNQHLVVLQLQFVF